MKKYFDIRCPYCFGQMHYNDVVFRRKDGEEKEDEYLKNYYEHFGNKWVQDMCYGFVDPADPKYSGYEREIKDGFLEGIKNPDKTANDFLEQRLCPFCHNKFLRNFGRAPTKYIAVIGVPGSGKTTYLASVNAMMKKRKENSFLWCNMDPYTKDFESLTDRYANGFQEGVATNDIQGPYFYTLTTENKSKTDIVFLDIPGECYVDERRLTPRIVNYVKYADGLIFIVNAAETVEEDSESVLIKTIDQVLSLLSEKGIPQKPTAIILNKIDLVSNVLIEGRVLPDVMPPKTDVAVDIEAVNEKSENIRKVMLRYGSEGESVRGSLRRYVNNIINNFGEDCRVFATRLIFRDNGNYVLSLDEGADTPFLWLLAKMGAFPVKQEKKKQ